MPVPIYNTDKQFQHSTREIQLSSEDYAPINLKPAGGEAGHEVGI